MADSAGNRNSISYDDTAALVRLAGSGPAFSPKGFDALRGWGAGTLTSHAADLAHDTGIRLLREDYAITAGSPPADATLLAGGQDASAVTSHFTRLGWKAEDGELAITPNPGLSGDGGNAAAYSMDMPRVRARGRDVAVGGVRADLSQVGTVPGVTLASDPLIGGLSVCLGNVVAAQIETGTGGLSLGGRSPVAVAVGVLRPVSATAPAQAVTCVAWPTAAAAGQYAKDVRQALASGTSAVTGARFSALLVHWSVTSVDGSQHIVRWTAQTPGEASRALIMSEDYGLPALPDCARLPVAARARIIGCG
jgi:hypothetical protein